MSGPNVLYITNGSPTYMPPLRLAECQVEMGPNMPDESTADGRVRLKLEAGEIDAPTLLSKLPKGFHPDLTFIQASSYRCAKPVGLSELPGKKILVIADLHHGTHPITSMLRYVERERIDGVIVTHGQHFVHWFAELNCCSVTMIPNFNVAGHRQPFQTLREPTILFIGQAGNFHPRRRKLLDAIKSHGLPLIEGQATPEDAARLYGQAQLVFNCSLNGDINMRVFEVLAAGGCLVTDRLSAKSRLGDMFKDGEHLAFYDDEADALSLLRRLLAVQSQALTMAENGNREYWAHHAPDMRRKQVLDFADACCEAPSKTGIDAARLMERAELYEILQEAQRQLSAPTPFMVDPELVEMLGTDADDLHLLRRVDWREDAATPCVILATEARRLRVAEGQILIAYSTSAHQGSRLPPS